MKICRVISIAVIFLAVSVCVHAAWIDPNIEDQLVAADEDQVIKAFVVLADQVDLPALLDDLHLRHATLAQRHYEVITAMQEKAAETQGSLLAMLGAAKTHNRVVKFRSYWVTNAVTIWARPDVFDELRARTDVSKVYLSYRIENIKPVHEAPPDLISGAGTGIEPGIEVTRAPELWAMGFDGSTAIAGDCDTGADGNHAAFASRWRGLSAPASQCWFDPVTSTTFPFDSGSHGTHTLGTIVGDDGGDNQIGMAPGAKWIAAGVIDRVSIQQTIDDAVLAFQWFADPDGNPGTMDDVPDVINNSWGISPLYHGVPACDQQMWAAIDTAEAAGVVAVFAAGNEGSSPNTCRTPADRIASTVNTFAVGALEQGGTSAAGFSSRGPSGCDGATIKPEVSAVGVSVRSSVPGDQYTTMDGTSMATPHVAGAVVLLRDAFPDATPEDVKMALYESAVDLGSPGEDNDYGMGRIDVVAAYYALQAMMASPEGKIFIDGMFSCSDVVEIRVSDSDLTAPTVNVSAVSTIETTPEIVILHAMTTPGIYEGSIQTAAGIPFHDGLLQVADANTITVTYIDADDGNGHSNVPRTDTADTDCAPPVFAGLTDLTVGDAVVSLTWGEATDDTPVAYNVYRATASHGQNFSAPIAAVHGTSYDDTTVNNGTEYFYVVRAEDAFGQEDANTVELSGVPIGPDYLLREDFETDGFSDWTIVDGGSSPATWTTDNPEGRRGDYLVGQFAIADKGAIGPFQSMDEQMISPPIDCSNHDQIFLRFGNEFEAGFTEYGDVEYSLDGQNWTLIKRYRYISKSERAEFDMPEFDFQPQVFLRFHYVASGPIPEFWAVDNIAVRGWPTATTTTTVPTTTTTTTTTGGDDDTDDDTAVDDTTADDTGVDDTADDDTGGGDDDASDDGMGDDDSAPLPGDDDDDDNGGCCG